MVSTAAEKQQYVLMYPTKEGKIVTIISKDRNGDCLVSFRNGRKDFYHFSWLKEVKNEATTTA